MCRWFTSYAGWGPGQLHREIVENGVWFCAAAGAEVMMRHVEHVNSTGLWHEVLRYMGGEYSALSEEMQKGLQRGDIIGNSDLELEFLGEEPPEEIQDAGSSS